MEFTPINPDQIPKQTRQGGSKTAQAIQAFLDSGTQLAEVAVSDGKKPESVRATLQNSIQRTHADAHVFVRSGRVFIGRGYKEPNKRAVTENGASAPAPEAEATPVEELV